MATGALDANGIWQYGEDDSNTTFSALLNRLASSVSTALGLIKNNAKGIIATTAGGTSGKAYYGLASAQTIGAGVSADITGMSMTFNAVAGRLYRATFLGYFDQSSGSSRYSLMFNDGANNYQRIVDSQVSTGWPRQGITESHIFTGSGSTTLKIRFFAIDAAINFYGASNASYQSKFFIEDIGAA